MFRPIRKTIAGLAAGAALSALTACSMMPGASSDKLTLTGAGEIPAVQTAATGTGSIKIGPDGAVSGSVTVSGMAPTMAHIHQAPSAGANGPVIVPFVQDGNTFNAPPGAKLTEVQMASYRAGNLYFNVHSAAHPGGEIRAYLKAPA
jgi:CHRD domain